MATHPGISSFICSVNNPATVSPCASRTNKGRLFGDLFVPLLYGAWLLVCPPKNTLPQDSEATLVCSSNSTFNPTMK